MKREVNAAVAYLQRMVVARSNLDEAVAQLFAEKLQKLLCDKYNDHWYPDCPSKGQAYRCIRINNGQVCDDVLLQACKEIEITPSELCLPPELTLWIDPMEVCARSKEHYRPFTIARFNKESVGAGTPDHTSDYHSATSSSCSSTSSSDNEEEAKDGETGPKKVEAVATPPAAEAGVCPVAMVPRIRRRYGDGPYRTRCFRNTLSTSIHYYYNHAPACPHYKKATTVYLTMCTAPPPPPPQQVFSYYILPQQPPQFIMPQASLHPWAPVMN
ncbi:protein BTG4 [Betta splendens]|uniref:Protein BTG4 n=1 Tax=Betta splendens TaxID=158456 RepID=A0A6P7KTB9_BETSP|nr:protein BTG4 [Betta splendens]XP_055359407.1 protein BTG4 [Betta splendens]